jgi:putative ABC transport system ATP-binding protein
MVETQNLKYAYKNGEQFSFPDINVQPGEHSLILGPSGIGKTTLLYLLAGLLQPTSGKISIAGTELNTLSRVEIDRFRGENIGLIFQQYHFIKSLNVSDNLKLRQSYPKNTKDEERRLNLSKRLGINDFLNKRVATLSQGQQQRLSIALGLIHKPKIILADEPTSNLDDKNCEKVLELLKEEASICGSSLIIITHDHRIKSHFKNQITL